MTKQTKSKNTKRIIVAVIVTAIFVASAISNGGLSHAVTVNELRDQANALQDQINQNNQRAEALKKESNTLKGKIAEYDSQIQIADDQIKLINIKLQQLAKDLEKAQVELDRQKGLLKASLQALYKKGGASTVELIVGSDSFSQFINDQTYLERLKSGIQTSAEKVITLKQQIQAQQKEQKTLLSQQEGIRQGLATAKGERQSLLVQTQGEEARYRSISDDLKQKQLAINREIISRSKVLVGSDGGYPYKNAQPWSGYYSCPGFDPWGMCMRSCTSFVAWRVASTGRTMPNFPMSGLGGNARSWPGSARALGIATGTTPRVGAAAVWTSGYYGHVGFVEEIYGDGRVRISEYNYVQDGRYDERLITPGYSSMPNEYVYF